MIQRKHSPRHFTSLLVIFLLLISGTPALAQSTATVQGVVTDESGAVMTGAQVVVRNTATGIERTTETDSSGNFQVAALPVGTYRIEVHAQGFQTSVVNELVLEVGKVIVQNFQLKV